MLTNTKVVTLSRNAMACRFELVLCGEDESRLRAAGEEALDEIDRLDAQLSAFHSDSELSGVNARAAREPVRVEPGLFRLLQTTKRIHDQTDGAFDITIAPLMRAWGFTSYTDRPAGCHSERSVSGVEESAFRPQPPPLGQLEAARQITGMSHVILDESSFTVRFDCEGVSLDLGAIGKGYAVQRAADILRDIGVTSALLHGGTSSSYAIGSLPDGPDWLVAIRDPTHPDQILTVAHLRDESLSVSAVHGKSFFKDGREYGHVIDPRTGQPTQNAILAAVIGPDATEGDALSTALLVLGSEWLPRLIEEGRGMKGLVAGRDENGAIGVTRVGI
jgi:FAD:protein FMN transferase